MAAVAAVAVAAAAIVLLSGGDEPSAQLESLQDDPMAEYVPPEGELVDTESRSEGESLGKPLAAEYSRLFSLPATDPERALEDAVAAAEAAGWTVEEPRQGALGGIVGQGTKQLETGRARLALTLYLDDRVLRDDVAPPALKVQLEHLSS